VEDERERCIYCGSTQVAQKSEQPRYKRYYDPAGNVRRVAVYRYYCHNPACEHDTFTNLPPDLLPHSPWSVGAHMLVLQGYAWGRSVYRRVGQGVGVSTATAYRWVSAWGQDLLPMAALFGVVRSSGVVGVDEKWVKVPKNDKPAGKRKSWMYVYLAVDVYTYDLLHIAIYPYLTKASARAFLLTLRVKGYRPRVLITDLRRDYADVVSEVFPQARHHECIFHALKWIQRQLKKVYGADYQEEHPAAVALKKEIYRIFQCQDKRTAQRRYRKVLQKRRSYVAGEPEVAAIFDTLQYHWPKLVNAMGSKVIPKTNNAVELVIRRFDQHYQNFCGFETLETARCYLAVFELVYRFTPFATYNQKDKERPPDQRIGGKCPLELAGYEVEKLPITQIFRGRILGWPDETLGELVPDV
jgi:transposase-like protein